MNIKTIRSLALILCVSTLAACSGGGGGGEGGSASSKSARTGIRVLHGAIDGSPLDVIAASAVIQNAKFGDATVHAGLGTGPQVITLSRAKDPALQVANFTIDVQKDDHYSILFFGDRYSFGLESVLLRDGAGELASGNGAIRVVHGMTGARSVNLNIAGVGSAGAEYGTASEYTQVPAGPYVVTVTRGSDGAVAYQTTVEVAQGGSYSVWVGGQQGYFVAGRVIQD